MTRNTRLKFSNLVRELITLPPDALLTYIPLTVAQVQDPDVRAYLYDTLYVHSESPRMVRLKSAYVREHPEVHQLATPELVADTWEDEYCE